MQSHIDEKTLYINCLSVGNLTARNLSVAAGAVVSLSAPSGAGKSLFLRALADLIPATSDIYLHGIALSYIAAPAWRRDVCYVAAKPAWWAPLVRDHFADVDWLKGKIECLGLTPDATDWPVQRLSSGEAQRLALLRGLEASDQAPQHVRYLLLDEPTSALDLERQLQVEAFLNSYLREKRIGVVMVSHDERQSARFAHVNWRVVNGQIEQGEHP